MKAGFYFFGIAFSLIGLFLVFNSITGITGYVVLDNYETGDSILGLLFFFTGIFLIKSGRAKGQEAIEFLMTYGWAVLAAVMVLGALTYLGVFNGNFSQPTTIALSPPFHASAANIQELSTGSGTGYRIGLELYKGDGKDYIIDSVRANSREGQVLCSYEPVNGETVLASEVRTIYLDCPNLNSDNFDGEIIIAYTNYDSNLAQTSSGSLNGRVVPATYSGSLCGQEHATCEVGESMVCDDDQGNPGEKLCNAECNGYDACIASPYCGDGSVNGAEECEFGDTQECLNEDGKEGTQLCSAACVWEVECVPNE